MTVIVGGRQKKLAETGGKLKGLGEDFNLSDKQNCFLCQLFIFIIFFVLFIRRTDQRRDVESGCELVT